MNRAILILATCDRILTNEYNRFQFQTETNFSDVSMMLCGCMRPASAS